MTRALCLAVLLLVECFSGRVFAQEPERSGQEAFIKRAAFAQQRLWLLADSGVLSSVADRGNERVIEPLPERALDLCTQNGDPLVVTAPEGRGGRWTLRRWRAGKWQSELTISRSREALLALGCAAGRVTLLTSGRLIDVIAGAPKTLSLSVAMRSPAIASIHSVGDQVYVGFNAGEWGGGLVRIDRRDGKLHRIESNVSGELCGGPLNTGCDPVNGITDEPWSPGCVIAAVGLVHFLSHGRIVEVCGDIVKRLYFKPQDVDSRFGLDKNNARKTDEPVSTVAFFGVERVGSAVWAVGTDGLYRITQDGAGERMPLPQFTDADGVAVSFEVPDVVLVGTQVNQRRSVSGTVPMLVPREASR